MRRRDLDHMLLDQRAGLMMQMPVVQVVDVLVVDDGGVAAAGAVLVFVVVMGGGHESIPDGVVKGSGSDEP
jgi:hypothetical protein